MAITTDLSGKTAIITGSNSGIGLGIAQELAKAGADVVLNSFTDREEDHALAADIAKETGVTARYIKADMSKGDECRALIEKAGACDILINNAGIQHVAGIPDFPVEKWDAIIAINLSSAFHTTAAALPLMRAAGWGRLINIASAHGLTASPYKSAYIAAKHGIVGLTKTTALETAEEPITANAICPGYVLTPLVESQIPDTMKEYDMSREDVIRNVMLTRQPSRNSPRWSRWAARQRSCVRTRRHRSPGRRSAWTEAGRRFERGVRFFVRKIASGLCPRLRLPRSFWPG
jgi:3-hydroxybutyrate dehydrogenase